MARVSFSDVDWLAGALAGHVSAEFARRRKALGLSQKQLAKQSGCSRMSIAHAETRPLPTSTCRFLNFCDALLIRQGDLTTVHERAVDRAESSASIWAQRLKARRTEHFLATREELAALNFVGEPLAIADFVRRMERRGPGTTALRSIAHAVSVGVPPGLIQEYARLKRMLVSWKEPIRSRSIRDLSRSGQHVAAWRLAWRQAATANTRGENRSKALLTASIVLSNQNCYEVARVLATDGLEHASTDSPEYALLTIQSAHCHNELGDSGTALDLLQSVVDPSELEGRPDEHLLRFYFASVFLDLEQFESAERALPRFVDKMGPGRSVDEVRMATAVLGIKILLERGKINSAKRLLRKVDVALNRFDDVLRAHWSVRVAPVAFDAGSKKLGESFIQVAKRRVVEVQHRELAFDCSLFLAERELAATGEVGKDRRRELTRRSYGLSISPSDYSRLVKLFDSGRN